jgi:hypothetical protein
MLPPLALREAHKSPAERTRQAEDMGWRINKVSRRRRDGASRRDVRKVETWPFLRARKMGQRK